MAGSLRVGPDEDGHRAVGGAGRSQRPDRAGHPGQLRLVGREATDLRRRARRQAGDEPLRRSRRGPELALRRRRPARGEDPVGQPEDLRCRAVVRLEPDDTRTWIARREADQVVAGRPCERVDRLVLVADDREVLAPAEPRLEQRRLERVGVLELVDGEPAISVADLCRDRVIALDQPDGPFEHVLEIDPAGTRLGRFVAAEQAGHQIRRQRRVTVLGERPGLVLSGADPACLGPLDLGGEVADREVSIAARQPGRQRREDRSLGGEDLRGVRAMDPWPEVPELAKGGRVERGGRHAPVAERSQPTGHLAGSLVRERDDQDITWPHDPGRERIGDPARDDPCLAAARSGEDAQGTRRDRHGLALGRIEVGQEVVGVGERHPAILVAGAAPRLTSRPVSPGAKPGSGARRSSRWPRSRSRPDPSHRRSPRRESLSSRVPSASCTPGVVRPETT